VKLLCYRLGPSLRYEPKRLFVIADDGGASQFNGDAPARIVSSAGSLEINICQYRHQDCHFGGDYFLQKQGLF